MPDREESCVSATQTSKTWSYVVAENVLVGLSAAALAHLLFRRRFPGVSWARRSATVTSACVVSGAAEKLLLDTKTVTPLAVDATSGAALGAILMGAIRPNLAGRARAALCLGGGATGAVAFGVCGAVNRACFPSHAGVDVSPLDDLFK